MRFHFVMMTAALLGLASCASSQAPVEAPGLAPGVPEGAPSEGGEEALPRYFSVTISSGGLSALGQALNEEQLQAWANQEAQDQNVAGAAVTAESGVSANQALSVIGLLVRSGFKHVVFSSRDGLSLDAEVSAATEPVPALESPAETLPSEQPESPAALAPPVALAEPEQVASNVEVKQLGLHIGGGPNNDEAHAVYAKPIQRRFSELQRCYALATGTQKNASFGVDLLISTRGGTAKIKDYRTSLGGKDFHLCVLGVFGTVEFPARDKATMVSYSVLFKPL
jgi:hypothetical protein